MLRWRRCETSAHRRTRTWHRSGYGSLRVDSLSITVDAGAAPIPEPASTAAGLAAAALVGVLLRRRRDRSAAGT